MSDARTTLRDLASAARTLHHRLLVAMQKNFEKPRGRVESSGALLQLAVQNPLFAWLRPLSQQLALLSELAEADEVADADLARERASSPRCSSRAHSGARFSSSC
jgi:hypothetical protein